MQNCRLATLNQKRKNNIKLYCTNKQHSSESKKRNFILHTKYSYKASLLLREITTKRGIKILTQKKTAQKVKGCGNTVKKECLFFTTNESLNKSPLGNFFDMKYTILFLFHDRITKNKIFKVIFVEGVQFGLGKYNKNSFNKLMNRLSSLVFKIKKKNI